jgi:hypothetical protein
MVSSTPGGMPLHTTSEPNARNGALHRSTLLKGSSVFAGALGMGVSLGARRADAATSLDAKAEAKKIAFDRIGNGENVLDLGFSANAPLVE